MWPACSQLLERGNPGIITCSSCFTPLQWSPSSCSASHFAHKLGPTTEATHQSTGCCWLGSPTFGFFSDWKGPPPLRSCSWGTGVPGCSPAWPALPGASCFCHGAIALASLTLVTMRGAPSAMAFWTAFPSMLVLVRQVGNVRCGTMLSVTLSTSGLRARTGEAWFAPSPAPRRNRPWAAPARRCLRS